MIERAKKSSKLGGDKWEGPLPKGWTDDSRKKFWDSLTAKAPKHKVTQCIKRMQGTGITNPGAFCAALADRVIPGWREEAVKERRKKRRKKALVEIDKVALSLNPPRRRDHDEDDQEQGHSVLPGSDTMSLGVQDKEMPRKLASSDWLSLSEIERLCPPCAEKMRRAGFRRVRASVVARLLMPRSG